MIPKSIVFVRANNYDCTPAILRAIEASNDFFNQIEVLDWSRTGEIETNQSCVPNLKIKSFLYLAPQRSLKVIFITLMYQWWLFWQLLFGKHDVIQVCDIMSGVPAAVVVLITRKKLIYDIRDPFALCYQFSKIIKGIAYSVDWCVMAISDCFVLPTDRYISYLGRWGKGAKEHYVLPNTCKDNYSDLKTLPSEVIPPLKNGFIRLAYLGYLDTSRGSEWLIKFCSDMNNKTELIVAGNCRDEVLLKRLRNAPNIYYVGRLSYAECWSLMADVDGITVLYDPSIPVNCVLDPTKFYESMMVGTPVLISKYMSLDTIVTQNELGFVIDHNSIDGLKIAVDQLRDVGIVKPLKTRCRKYYQDNLNLDNEMIKYKEFYSRVYKLLK